MVKGKCGNVGCSDFNLELILKNYTSSDSHYSWQNYWLQPYYYHRTKSKIAQSTTQRFHQLITYNLISTRTKCNNLQFGILRLTDCLFTVVLKRKLARKQLSTYMTHSKIWKFLSLKAVRLQWHCWDKFLVSNWWWKVLLHRLGIGIILSMIPLFFPYQKRSFFFRLAT